MSDFTKEELEIIDQALCVAVNEGAMFYAEERINLRLKIQSMIDNFPDSHPDKCPHGITERNCPHCFEANNE